MPGPRKNLTPLDMQMLGLADTQGGIINFLGKQPEVTAPIRAQSHADSPPTQLAYITDAEKDLLVKANIHGSMDGKPNPGPAGLESLDDIYISPSGKVSVTTGAQASAQEKKERGGRLTQQEKRDIKAAPPPTTMPSGQATVFDKEGKATGQVWDQKTKEVTIPKEKKEEEKKDDNWVKDAWETVQKAGGIFTSIPVAFFKKLAHPTMEDFKDPNFLAVINKLFEEKNKELGIEGGKQFKKDYVADYKKLMDEAFAGNEAMLAQGLSSEEFFNQQLKEASDLSKMGELGKGSQRINFPEEFYLDDKEKGIMPQTTGGLEDLAALATTGPNAITDPNLRQMIFDARNELDKQQGGQGGGAGIPSLAAPSDPINVTFPSVPPEATPDLNLPGVILGYGPGDMAYTAVMPREGYQYTHDAAGNRYEIPIGGATSGETYGGRPFTWRPTETAQTPITTPTPFNYSQWPQFGPAGGPVPNYVNQGLGSAPQFNYWNQIANTFPGMR